MTHAELVARAERWLRNTLHCGVVLTELCAYTRSGETPDAIGWANGTSVLVECKVSRADYKADLKKRSRLAGFPAMGGWRVYLAEKGVLSADELTTGWSLYEVNGKRVEYAGGARYSNCATAPFSRCMISENALLVSALRRIQAGDKEGLR